jgi:hypothetical protein
MTGTTIRPNFDIDSFKTSGNLKTKSMQDLMAVSGNLPWAAAILDADRQNVVNANLLNAQNRNQNTYGLVNLGVNIQVAGWRSNDQSVNQDLTLTMQRLNDLFQPRQTYTPKELLQIAANMEAASKILREVSASYTQAGEIEPSDTQRLEALAEGFADGCSKIRALHHAVTCDDAPPIDVISMDVPAARH